MPDVVTEIMETQLLVTGRRQYEENMGAAAQALYRFGVTDYNTAAILRSGASAVQIAAAGVRFYKDAIETAMDRQSSFQRATLGFRGSITANEIAKISRSLERLSGIDAKDIAEAMGLLGGSGLKPIDAKTLIGPILDASVALKARGLTVTQIAVQLGKALQTGEPTALRRADIIVDQLRFKAASATDRVKMLVEALEAKGPGAASLDTPERNIARLDASIRQLRESLGTDLVPLANNVIKAATGGINAFNSWPPIIKNAAAATLFLGGTALAGLWGHQKFVEASTISLANELLREEKASRDAGGATKLLGITEKDLRAEIARSIGSIFGLTTEVRNLERAHINAAKAAVDHALAERAVRGVGVGVAAPSSETPAPSSETPAPEPGPRIIEAATGAGGAAWMAMLLAEAIKKDREAGILRDLASGKSGTYRVFRGGGPDSDWQYLRGDSGEGVGGMFVAQDKDYASAYADVKEGEGGIPTVHEMLMKLERPVRVTNPKIARGLAERSTQVQRGLVSVEQEMASRASNQYLEVNATQRKWLLSQGYDALISTHPDDLRPMANVLNPDMSIVSPRRMPISGSLEETAAILKNAVKGTHIELGMGDLPGQDPGKDPGAMIAALTLAVAVAAKEVVQRKAKAAAALKKGEIDQDAHDRIIRNAEAGERAAREELFETKFRAAAAARAEAKRLAAEIPKPAAAVEEVKAAVSETAAATSSKLPGYVQEQMDREFALAQRLGIVNDIQTLSAQGLTAGQVADRLKLRTEFSGVQGIRNSSLVRSVRNKLGIPSMDERAEFAAWQKRFLEQNPAAVTGEMMDPAKSVTSHSGGAISTVADTVADAIKEAAPTVAETVAVTGAAAAVSAVIDRGKSGRKLQSLLSPEEIKALAKKSPMSVEEITAASSMGVKGLQSKLEESLTRLRSGGGGAGRTSQGLLRARVDTYTQLLGMRGEEAKTAATAVAGATRAGAKSVGSLEEAKAILEGAAARRTATGAVESAVPAAGTLVEAAEKAVGPATVGAAEVTGAVVAGGLAARLAARLKGGAGHMIVGIAAQMAANKIEEAIGEVHAGTGNRTEAIKLIAARMVGGIGLGAFFGLQGAGIGAMLGALEGVGEDATARIFPQWFNRKPKPATEDAIAPVVASANRTEVLLAEIRDIMAGIRDNPPENKHPLPFSTDFMPGSRQLDQLHTLANARTMRR